MYTVKQAISEKEIEAILQLRYKLLREPWNQPYETSSDGNEESSVNAYIEDSAGKIIACGRLQENENKIGQIRYMAVDTSFQGRGLGKLVVEFLEKKAGELHLDKIQLQARENALEFYKGRGYTIKEKSFLLWGMIQHYLMEKKIEDHNNS
jgi:N-acetylglutamate synthase-like GNAT family acetyltransferase